MGNSVFGGRIAMRPGFTPSTRIVKTHKKIGRAKWRGLSFQVELSGFEPLTYSMRMNRSPN